MMKGLENVFKAGVQYGSQLAIEGEQRVDGIEDVEKCLSDDKK